MSLHPAGASLLFVGMTLGACEGAVTPVTTAAPPPSSPTTTTTTIQRAPDVSRGHAVSETKCQSRHATGGGGIADSIGDMVLVQLTMALSRPR